MSSPKEYLTFLRDFPDIQPNTHIFAICGVDKLNCSPQEDGWMLSDFYLLNNMLKGLGASQTWYTMVHPREVVEKYEFLLHGNPVYAQRVVLSDQVRPSSYYVASEEHFLDMAMGDLIKKCNEAHFKKEPVLLMIFAHGDPKTSGCVIGSSEVKTPRYLTTKDIQKIVTNRKGLQFTLMTTSCHAGRWADVENISTITASGKDESISWQKSVNSKRYDGGIWCSVLASVLEESNPGILVRPDQEGQKEVSYREFAELMKSRLRELDSTAHWQDFKFSAQDGRWKQEFHQRTGIPMAEFTKRLNTLPIHLPAPGNSNRTPAETQALLKSRPTPERSWHSLIRKTAGSRGGRYAFLRGMSERYIRSNPGPDNVPSNQAVHSFAHLCIDGQLHDEERQAKLIDMLIHRFDMEQLADELVSVMKVVPFEPHWTWDQTKWLDGRKGEFNREMMSMIQDLLPKPGETEGREWRKPALYLTAAYMAKGLSRNQFDKAIADAKRHIQLHTDTRCGPALEIEIRGRTFKKLGGYVREKLRSLSVTSKGQGQ